MIKKYKTREYFDTTAIKNGKKENKGLLKSEEAMRLLDEKECTGLHVDGMVPLLTMEGVNIWFETTLEREEFLKEYFEPSFLDGDISLTVTENRQIEVGNQKLSFQNEEEIASFLEDFVTDEEELVKSKVKIR